MTPEAMGTIGFIGASAMGSGMITNLLKGGFAVRVFDVDAAKLDAVVAEGALRGTDAVQLVRDCMFVLCSLPSSQVFVRVAEEALIPNARTGQVFIDFGTTAVPEARRIAALLEARGARLLDTPVSGSPRTQGFRVFIGGDKATAERCRPIFDAQTEPRFAVYCGPSGAGQIVKGVNQLGMGLISAACMEAVAFGVASGVSPEIIGAAVGGDSGFRRDIGAMAAQAASGEAVKNDAKFAELPYFLAQAHAAGFAIPLTQALHTFCEPAARQWRDNMNRPYVSFWHRLMHPHARKAE